MQEGYMSKQVITCEEENEPGRSEELSRSTPRAKLCEIQRRW